MELIETVQNLFKTNPVFAGMVGAGMIGGVVVQLRSLPKRLWNLFLDQFVVSLKVHHDQRGFLDLSRFLSKGQDAKRARRLNLIHTWNAEKQVDEFHFTPGEGFHLLTHKGRRFLVHREVKQPEPNAVMGSRQETLTLRTLGRSQKVMVDLLADVQVSGIDPDTLPVYVWNRGAYNLVDRRTKRDLSTIYMNAETKAALIADTKKFLGRRTWYGIRSIPWRRGYLLEGPPGTGKSSLIFAVASHLDRAIYIINPATLSNDSELAAAMSSAEAGIVVIEDIDSVQITKDRAPNLGTYDNEVVVAIPGSAAVEPQKEAGKGLTLSGFLNAIDGIAAKEGRMLFITSNHADTLDPALLRPGRIDRRIYMGHSGEQEAREMFRVFFPEGDEEAFMTEVTPSLPMAASALQNLLLSREEGFAECVDLTRAAA